MEISPILTGQSTPEVKPQSTLLILAESWMPMQPDIKKAEEMEEVGGRALAGAQERLLAKLGVKFKRLIGK